MSSNHPSGAANQGPISTTSTVTLKKEHELIKIGDTVSVAYGYPTNQHSDTAIVSLVLPLTSQLKVKWSIRGDYELVLLSNCVKLDVNGGRPSRDKEIVKKFETYSDRSMIRVVQTKEDVNSSKTENRPPTLTSSANRTIKRKVPSTSAGDSDSSDDACDGEYNSK